MSCRVLREGRAREAETPEARAAERQGLVLSVLEKPIALAHLEENVKLALARTASP